MAKTSTPFGRANGRPPMTPIAAILVAILLIGAGTLGSGLASAAGPSGSPGPTGTPGPGDTASPTDTPSGPASPGDSGSPSDTPGPTGTPGPGPTATPTPAPTGSPPPIVLVPDAPTTVVAAAGDAVASVSWVAPSSDGGSPVLGYAVTPHDLTTSSDGVPIPAGSTSTTVTGLANGDTYTFTVTAANGAGASAPSSASAPVEPQLSAPPPQTTITTIPPDGGTASSDPTSSGQIIADVTVPAGAGGGSVTMATTTVDTAPAGYVFLGQQVIIVSTATTSVSNPLVLTFNIDPALVPVDIFRDGVVVGACTGTPGTAAPSPCIASGAGTSQVTVLTAAASHWNIGLRRYTFSGFFSPVDNQPTVNLAKGGSAIPLKFGLGGDRGLAIFAAGYPKSQVVTCDSTAPVDGIDQTASPGAATLSFDPGSARYQYVWKTDKAWKGTCRQLVVRFQDGSIQRATFKFS